MVAEEKADVQCISAESAERLRHREQSSQGEKQVWRQEFEKEILQTLAISDMQSPKHLLSESMMAISRGLLEEVIKIVHAREGKDVVRPCPPPRRLQLSELPPKPMGPISLLSLLSSQHAGALTPRAGALSVPAHLLVL